jgi:hypothetical protein
VTTTEASGTTAPVLSVTVPLIVARNSWALIPTGINNNTTATQDANQRDTEAFKTDLGKTNLNFGDSI